MTVFVTHPYQTKEKVGQLAIEDSRRPGQFIPPSSCPVKFQDGETKPASRCWSGFKKEPARAASWKQACCVLVISRQAPGDGSIS